MPSLRLVATWSTPPAPSCRRRTRVSSTMFSKSGTSSWWVVFFPGYELVRFILIFYNFHFPGIQFCFKCSIKKHLCVQVLNGFVIKKKQQVYELICWIPFKFADTAEVFFYMNWFFTLLLNHLLVVLNLFFKLRIKINNYSVLGADWPGLWRGRVHQVPGAALPSHHEPLQALLSTHAQHGWVFCGQN